MPEPAPQAELMHSLGQLVRGLSALFWGLPLALFIGVQVTKTDWLRPFGVVPPLLASSLLYYGLFQVGQFQKQERIWMQAVERLKLLGLINVGLSPFLFWWQRLPELPFFSGIVSVLALASLLFLAGLNQMLQRLTAMLPDETLRHDSRFFTSMNLAMLTATVGLVIGFPVLIHWKNPSPILARAQSFLHQENLSFLVLLVLVPVATTMALIWKIKEAIFSSVFGPGRAGNPD